MTGNTKVNGQKFCFCRFYTTASITGSQKQLMQTLAQIFASIILLETKFLAAAIRSLHQVIDSKKGTETEGVLGHALLAALLF